MKEFSDISPAKNTEYTNWLYEYWSPNYLIGLRVKQQLYHSKNKFQEINILETHDFGRMLVLDYAIQCTEKDEFFYHEMLCHVPLMAHKNPEQVLVIGGGDGGAIREILKHPSVKKAVLAEIDGEVVEACKKYLPTISCALNGNDKRVDVKITDGAEYVRNKKGSLDVILGDIPDPIGPAKALYMKKFFEDVYAALKDDGMFAFQSESPLINKAHIKQLKQMLTPMYKYVRVYTTPMPTYPSAYWSFIVCSKKYDPTKPARAEPKGLDATYYNEEIHSAAFATPNFLKN